MWEFLTSALSAIPSAASNKYALGAYALAICAYVITVWRVARNKNLLDNLQKLPSKDRLSALEIETGGVRLAAGISPEQWVRSRIHKYYLFAFLATCAVAVAIAALAAWKGATYVGTLTIINNEYQRSNNGESLSSVDLQHIKDLIDAKTTRDLEQARNQLSEKARAAYDAALAKGNLPPPGELTSGASTTPLPTKPSAVATDRIPATAGTAEAAPARAAVNAAVTSPPGSIFSDEFRNRALSAAWQVDNPKPDNFAVEDGHLLVIAHAAGGLSKADSQNIFRLVKPAPESDWSITAQLTVKFQTAREDFYIGLFDDAKNYLVARLYADSNANGNFIRVQVLKVSGGETTELHLDARTAGGEFVKFSDTITQQPISIRLTKKGPEYRAAANFAGDVDNAGSPVWLQAGSVTSLHPPKTFVMYATQRDTVAGESTFYVSSVKIEALP
jgi:hypothetical protein